MKNESFYKLEQEITALWVNKDELLLSVICLTYNQEKYIKEAIDSFLEQKTNFRFEIIIHDDCSSDATQEMVSQYVERYPNIIRYIRQPENLYSQGERVIASALSYSQAKYIALCDGDDCWNDAYKLQKQVDILERDLQCVITYHDIEVLASGAIKHKNFGGSLKNLSGLELQKAKPIYTLTACFRNVIGKFPPEFDSARYGDLCVWTLLGEYGYGVFVNEIKPAKYRVHTSSVFSLKSKKEKYRMLLVTYSAFYAYYKRIGNKTLQEYFLGRIFFTAIRSIGFMSLPKVVCSLFFEKLKISK